MADYANEESVPWRDHRSIIRSVKIGSGVTCIGDWAFTDCANLASVSIPDAVAAIGESAFSGCNQLNKVTLTSGLTCIGDSAFQGCAGLHDLTIPDSVETIGTLAFQNCAEDFTITGSCNTAAHKYAKENKIATSLQHGETVPVETVEPTCTEDGHTAGTRCTKCKEIISGCEPITKLGHIEVIDPYLPATRTQSGMTEGRHCDRCKEILIPQKEIKPLTDISVLALPGDVKEIRDEAFMGSLIECAVLPEDCESIGSKAFANCASLKLIEIPASVIVIAADAFEDSPNVVIVTTAGSLAETFAQQHGLNCRIISR